MAEYLYSWSERGQYGWRQTIENGRVVNVVSMPIKEAKEQYYATRSGELQSFDKLQEEIASAQLEASIKE